MKFISAIIALILLTGCWPSSVSFVDGTMHVEWKTFFVKTLENNAPNTPLSYAPNLSEDIKDGIQNKTKLQLNSSADDAEIEIEGLIVNYSITPIAMQEGDNASRNRLTISVNFKLFIHAPEEDEMTLVSTRFIDYDSNIDLGIVETQLLAEVNSQIVQDVINKLLSNW